MNFIALAGILATVNGSAMFGDQVLLRVNGPVQGSAFLFRSGDSCAAFTAYHVVENGGTVKLVSGGGGRYTGSVGTQWRSHGLDVAMLRLDNMPMAACPNSLDLAQGARAMQQPVGLIVSLDPTDRLKRIPVSIVSVDAERIELRLLYPVDVAYASLSGSPLIFDSSPVAVVVRSENGVIEAVPLTAIAGVAPSVFSQSVAAFVPYDLDLLPPDVQVVVEQARRNRTTAESAAHSANEAADQGAAAEQRAIAGTPGYVDIAVDNGRYRGEASQNPHNITADGFGRRTVIGGGNDGNISEGVFNGKDDGRMYSGRLRFASNANNTGNNSLYEGQFDDSGNIGGFGILTKQRGYKFFGKFVDGNLSESAVWESDGDRLEVFYKNGQPNGLGAEWDGQGRLTRCGVWENGNFSKAVPGCPDS